MIRFSIASLIAIALAIVIAAQLGGSLGNGVLAGTGLGIAFCALGAIYMAHTLRSQPQQALQAFGIAFLIKLFVLILGALAFRFIPQAAGRVDYRGFLLAYASVIAILVPLGSLDALRGLQQQIKNANRPARSESGL